MAEQFLPSPLESKAPEKPETNKSAKYKPESFQGVSPALAQRIFGRYGSTAGSIILDSVIPDNDNIKDNSLITAIENTPNIWAEICYAAKHEKVQHLSDLMLRRVRIGLLLPNGGIDLLDKIENLCRPLLPWDKERWEKEKKEYALLWKSSYSPPK